MASVLTRHPSPPPPHHRDTDSRPCSPPGRLVFQTLPVLSLERAWSQVLGTVCVWGVIVCVGGDRVCWGVIVCVGGVTVCMCVCWGGDPSADRSRMPAPSVSESRMESPSPRLVVQETTCHWVATSANGFLEAAWKEPAAELSVISPERCLNQGAPDPRSHTYDKQQMWPEARIHQALSAHSLSRSLVSGRCQSPETGGRVAGGALCVAGLQGGQANAGQGQQLFGYPGIWALLGHRCGETGSSCVQRACRGVTRDPAGLPCNAGGWDPIGTSAV